MQVVSEPQAFLSNQHPPFGAGMAARGCHLATSADQPGDAVVDPVRSRVRNAPASDKSNPLRRGMTHGASTGLAVGPDFRFGTNAKCRPALKLSAYWGIPEEKRV